MPANCRILILSIKAGSGHIRAADALEQVLRDDYPRIEVRNIEGLEYTNVAFGASYSQAYNRLATDLPSIWGLIYHQLEKKGVSSAARKLSTLFDRMNSKKLIKLAREYDADAIICTHFFPAEALGLQRLRGKLRSKVYVACTDYDIHSMWVQEGVDHYFVATPDMEFALRAKGIGDASVSVTGVPIMPIFDCEFPDRQTVRRRLALPPERPTVLLLAGGMGMTALDETVAVLAENVRDAQFLAVAGNNEKLYAEVAAIAEDHPGRVIPFSYVDNIHELMAASDFVITKSGGLTSGECLAMGLPMIILRPIPGQEERNADYLLESGAAIKANTSAHLVYKTRRLLSDRPLLLRMRRAARRTAHPRAAFEIIEHVVTACRK